MSFGTSNISPELGILLPLPGGGFAVDVVSVYTMTCGSEDSFLKTSQTWQPNEAG